MPTGIPSTNGKVGAERPVTVLDDGSGAQLCVAGVQDSLPPQCAGPPLVGWDWDEQEGHYEEAAGTRWGEFAVTGRFDGTSMTPSRITPAGKFTPSPPANEKRPRTSCPEPSTGWVEDLGRVSAEDLNAAFATASGFDDFASSFVDDSLDPRTGLQRDQEATEGKDDVSVHIVNVRVTQDTAAAENAIRQVWGGGLCVIRAEHTAAELDSIQQSLLELPGFLSSGAGGDSVDVHVLYDDGSIQTWADQAYDPGVILVTSALREHNP